MGIDPCETQTGVKNCSFQGENNQFLFPSSFFFWMFHAFLKFHEVLFRREDEEKSNIFKKTWILQKEKRAESTYLRVNKEETPRLEMDTICLFKVNFTWAQVIVQR